MRSSGKNRWSNENNEDEDDEEEDDVFNKSQRYGSQSQQSQRK